MSSLRSVQQHMHEEAVHFDRNGRSFVLEPAIDRDRQRRRMADVEIERRQGRAPNLYEEIVTPVWVLSCSGKQLARFRQSPRGEWYQGRNFGRTPREAAGKWVDSYMPEAVPTGPDSRSP